MKKLRGLGANTLLGNISSCFHGIYLWPSHCNYCQSEDTPQDNWGVCKLVQCVSVQYTADMHFEACNGLVLQERGVSTNASETKDFPNGASLFLRTDFCHFLSC